MAERKVLLDNLPQDSSPSIVRLINMYNPVKSLETLSADSDLTLAQVRQKYQCICLNIILN
jgi:nitrogen permease regulator 3-like protein